MRRWLPGLCAAAACLAVPATTLAAPAPLTVAQEQALCQSPPSAAQGPLSGRVIVVDPGEGLNPTNGTYVGAHGVNGAWEDVNNLDIACRLLHLLTAEGASAYIVRGTYDPGPPPVQGLIARVKFAESHHAQVYLSIHQNAVANRFKRGVGTYYFHSNALMLAKDVQNAMMAQTGLSNAGLHRAPDYVLRNNPMPAVLVEGGYLSNRTESVLITTPAFHQLEAQALNSALLTYFGASPATQTTTTTGKIAVVANAA